MANNLSRKTKLLTFQINHYSLVMNTNEVRAILDLCLEKLKTTHHYSQHHVDLLMTKLTITFSDRMRTKAGACRWRHLNGKVVTIGIQLSTLFLSRVTSEKQFQLISHEFAHAYEAIQTGGVSTHGPLWQSIHRAMGGNARQYHTEKMPHNKVKRNTLVNVLTGQVYNNVSTRMTNKCLRINQNLGYVKYEIESSRTV